MSAWSLALENLKDKWNAMPLPRAQETWIRALIAIQLVVFLLALFARKRAILQGVIFLAAGVDTMFVKYRTYFFIPYDHSLCNCSGDNFSGGTAKCPSGKALGAVLEARLF